MMIIQIPKAFNESQFNVKALTSIRLNVLYECCSLYIQVMVLAAALLNR